MSRLGLINLNTHDKLFSQLSCPYPGCGCCIHLQTVETFQPSGGGEGADVTQINLTKLQLHAGHQERSGTFTAHYPSLQIAFDCERGDGDGPHRIYLAIAEYKGTMNVFWLNAEQELLGKVKFDAA